MMEWNLNNMIWVKVYPIGYEHLKKQSCIEGHLRIWKKLIERDAYIPMQMHQFIALFGNVEGVLSDYVGMVCYIQDEDINVPHDMAIIPFSEVV